jgi:hypothetical protein
MAERTSIVLLATVIGALMVGTHSASAQQQSGDDCAPYARAIEPKDGAASALPDRLLGDSPALRCLLRLIKDLRPHNLNGQLDSTNLSRFISATSAVRILMANADRKDTEAQGSNAQNSYLVSFIKQFHQFDSLEVIEALAYGLRQDNSDARSNSLAILGNVIDNRFACIIFDHLYDTQGIDDRARANLLAVVSVIAPWAYAENFDNICRWIETAGNKIDRERLPQTARIIDNLSSRLYTQTDQTNQSAWLPESARACYEPYKPRNSSVIYQKRRFYDVKCKKR